MDDDFAPTLGSWAKASNPGAIRVRFTRWMLYKPRWPLIWFGVLAASVVAALILHWAFWIAASLMLACNVFYWMRLRDHFRSGCICAGVVVATKPLLIAVSTDLTQCIGQFPAIKILRASLARRNGVDPAIGTRVPTVSLYASAPEEQEHWSNFFPHPVEYATGDEQIIAGVMRTIGEEEWTELDDQLRQLLPPYKPGLYLL